MKRIILLLVSGLLIQISIAQDYVSFPNENAQWNDFYFGYVPNMWSSIFNYHYIQEGDTIINELTYHKMFLEYPDGEDDRQYIGAIREDENKNIFFFPASGYLGSPTGHEFPNNTEEHLVYTFDNMSVGMVLPINQENITITVLGIDSVLMGDSYRKRYHISHGMYDDYWIEGIGSIYELFSPFTELFFEWSLNTLCYTDTETYYVNSPNGEDSCHYYINVGLKEIDNSFSFYPNPVQDIFTIESIIAIEEIIIYNLQGQAVLRQEIDGSTINFEAYPSGVYFIEIQMEDNRIRKKLIKE